MSLRAGLGIVTAGVLAGQLATAVWLPPGSVLVALPVAGLVGWLAAGRRVAFGWAAVALTAAAAGAARMEPLVAPQLAADDVGRLSLPLRTTLEGRLAAAPERREHRTILLVAAEAIGVGAARRPASGLVRVGLRGAGAGWRYGDRLRLEAMLRAPRNFENPGRFDYVGHLARRGVRVTAFAWDERAIARLPGRARGVRARLERWRARLAARIRAAVPPPEGEVLVALVVGDEGGLQAEVRDAFTRAGVVHVLSISGLHIGIVAAAGFVLVRRLIGRSERLLLAVDAERVAGVLSLPPVALYAALAGLGIATVRSALMVSAAALAALAGRRADVLRTLALAALALALLWPGTPFEISFQLSFVSVLAIVLGTRRFPGPTGSGWRARLVGAALASPCALVGTAPLTAFHFHQVSLAGLVANPVTLPLFGSVVVGLGLTGACLEPFLPGAAVGLFHAGGWALRPGIALVRALGAPAWAALEVPIPSVSELAVLYALLGGLLLLPRRVGRALVLVASVALLADLAWWTGERFAPRGVRVTFLDVGQGDAAVAELPGGRVLVVDAGGFPGADFDTGAAVVDPFLWTRKIRRIDALVMTHAHPDHSGGLAHLLAHHAPREFWWTGVPGEGQEWDRLAAALAASPATVRVLAAGSPLPAFARDVAVLHPPPDWGRSSLNDSSLTLRLAARGAGVLLTGDIEARAEQSLLRDPGALRSRVLKVPHHGSRTSSGASWLAAVDPAVSVISVGAANRYRLPSPEIEARYRARGGCLLRTDRCGAVVVRIDGSRLEVRGTRPGCGCPGR